MTDDPSLVSLGACMGGPVYKVHADGEEVSECVLCGVILPTDVVETPFLGWSAWCERGKG